MVPWPPQPIWSCPWWERLCSGQATLVSLGVLGSDTVCGTWMWDWQQVPVLVLVGSSVMLAVNSGELLLTASVWK